MADRLEVVGAEGLGREVAEILGDQDLSTTTDGRSQDMPVFRIISHLVDECLVAGHERVGESLVHLFKAVRDPLLIQPTTGEVALQLGHNHRRPQRSVDASFGDAEQRVA